MALARRRRAIDVRDAVGDFVHRVELLLRASWYVGAAQSVSTILQLLGAERSAALASWPRRPNGLSSPLKISSNGQLNMRSRTLVPARQPACGARGSQLLGEICRRNMHDAICPGMCTDNWDYQCMAPLIHLCYCPWYSVGEDPSHGAW